MTKESSDIMAKLLASFKKPVTLYPGIEVEGTVVTKSDKELVLDLGAKSEGVLPVRDLPHQLDNLKVGDKLKVFVVETESDAGQVRLSWFRVEKAPKQMGRVSPAWNKMISAKTTKSKIQGKIVDSNKGGLIVEIEGLRGFIPSSQVGGKVGIGEDVSVFVSEVDQAGNRLIFSQRGTFSEDQLKTLEEFKLGQKVQAKVFGVFSFGISVVLNDSVFGFVFVQEAAWEKTEDLNKLFKVGQEVEVMVLGIDTDLARVNLSIKQTKEDNFSKLAQKYEPDTSIKGEVSKVSETGVLVEMEEGIEGFVPASKLEGRVYQVGEKVTFIVDNVDKNRRRVNLAPLLTTTKGLIYK